jgi:hypothetical protein
MKDVGNPKKYSFLIAEMGADGAPKTRKTPRDVLERSKLYYTNHKEEIKRKAVLRHQAKKRELAELGYREKPVGRPRLPLEEKIKRLIEKERGLRRIASGVKDTEVPLAEYIARG